MQTVVVTGVSSGIGFATTELLTREHIHVFGSVRTQTDADRLSQLFGNFYTPLIFDITDAAAVHRAVQLVKQKLAGQTLTALINNAGISTPGPLLFLPLSDFERSFKVNLEGQILVTQAFAPLLGIDRNLTGSSGKIINISSVVGKMVSPFFGASSIAKHGFEAFSDCLRIELMGFGIKVIVIEPGPITSAVWEKDKALIPQEFTSTCYATAIQVMNDYLKNSVQKKALPASVIADLILTILNKKHPKNSYVCVPNKFFNWTLLRLIPKRWLEVLIAKKLKLNAIKNNKD